MDELDELREALVGARAEADRLAEDLADREARSLEMAAETESLRRRLEAARAETAEVRQAASDESRRLTERYREALLASLGDVPPDLLRGESVDDLDRAAATAREMMRQAREQAQAEAAARIPAGSPARATPDLGSLSATEKIRMGIASRE
jgi:F0F1-type ATP synthase membrane subunit b/b'